MKSRICHMGSVLELGGLIVISSLCYSRPRSIARATWTIRPAAVTCPKCKALLTATQVKAGKGGAR